MLGKLKPLLVIGVIIALPIIAFVAAAPQDPVVVQRKSIEFHQEARWNFAALQYTAVTGEKVEIPARNLSKLWLLARPDGGLFLEILYENSDYSLVTVREMHVIRRSGTNSPVDVPIIRGTIEEMAFPGFRE